MRPTQFDLSGKRVLVTGGTGFIGGRLVEKLVLECNANVRVLVRDLARSSRIARLPIEMVRGDLTEPSDMQRAIRGCDIIFHCAYGNSGDEETRRVVNVEGTKNVLAAALDAEVKRVVHLSTLMVYGVTPDTDLDETAPRRYCGSVYADSKLDAEKLAFAYIARHNLPVAIIQPGTVYGPFAPFWTTAVLKALKSGRLILVNGGDGLCHAVYVDDIVSAMLLAAVRPEAVGEAFLISADQPVTWRDFYGGYERMLGMSATVTMSRAEAEVYYHKKQRATALFSELCRILREDPRVRERLLQTRELAALIKMTQSLLPERAWKALKARIKNESQIGLLQSSEAAKKPIHPLDPSLVRFCGTKSRLRIDKAKRLLGYQPMFDFESGMKLTEEWARWANLL